MQPNDSTPQTSLSNTEPPAPAASHTRTIQTTQTTLPPQSSAVLVVKQWLTYGLWSWTLLSLSILLSSTLTYFIIKDQYDYTFTLYVLAALVCLVPISYIVDRLYSKAEPEHKHGFAAVIMVIHAVLAFLISLGALITAVVTALTLITDASPTNSKYVVIASSLLIAILGMLFFARIMQPARLRPLSRGFPLIIVAVTIVVLVAAIAGPVKSEAANKQDRLVENNLDSVALAVDNYAQTNKHLPDSLSDVSFDNSYQQDARLLVTRNLVAYHTLSNTSNDVPDSTVTSTAHPGVRLQIPLSYQLCVTYKHAKGSGSTRNQISNSSYIDTSSHPAGYQCYTLTTYTY